MFGNLLEGKKGLIMGVANNKSIAWGIAEICNKAGAKLAFTYQSDALLKRLEPLANSIGSNILIECDVSDPNSVTKTFKKLKENWDSFDFLVHAIGFSNKNELRGRYIETSKENFTNTLSVSTFSLTEVSKKAENMINEGGSILTLTYYGSEKVLPHYNVMGVAKAALESSVRYLANSLGKENTRVNAISAGPVRTLAASGVKNFRKMLSYNAERTPLKRNITAREVGDTASFLCSDLASGITGEITYVDAGFNITAMGDLEEIS